MNDPIYFTVGVFKKAAANHDAWRRDMKDLIEKLCEHRHFYTIRKYDLDSLREKSSYIDNSVYRQYTDVMNGVFGVGYSEFCFFEKKVINHWKNLVDKEFLDLNEEQQFINAKMVSLS